MNSVSESEKNEFLQSVATTVRTEIINASLDNKEQLHQQVQILSRKEICKLLKISLPTLWKLMKNGSVPYFRAGGRRILFDQEQVLKYLRDNQKKMNFHR